MKTDGYWSRVTKARLSRRRALAGAATFGAGAAALSLVGCGGSDDGGGGAAKVVDDPNAIIFSWQLPDESEGAVFGGTMPNYSVADITGTLDPMQSSSFTTVDSMGGTVYDVLLWDNSGPGIEPRSAEGRKIIGNLAEKYEISADAVSYTLKMQQNVKFHDIAPVSGRVMDIEDWKTSFDRYMETSPFKANLTELIDKIETPDKSTMVIKLKEPSVAFLKQLTSARSSILILPKELNANPEIAATKPIGTRWMILDKVQPSVTREYRRHDDYWRGKPYLERWHYPQIPEYANQYAQMITGHIIGFIPRQTDVLRLRGDAPKARMFKGNPGGQVWYNFFSYQTLDAAPWKDVRVRQALRMSGDWDSIRAYFSNSGEFEAAGIPVESRMHTFIAGGGNDYAFWLDPKKGELGDVSKFFVYNAAEAKKLLSAAGVTTPIELTAYQHNGANYGTTYQELGDVTADSWNKSGNFKVNVERMPYPQYLDQIYQRRDFKGVSIQHPEFVYTETDLNLFNWYHSRGSRFKWVKGDTKLDEMIIKQRVETDLAKRTTLIQDIQKYMATVFGVVPGDGTSGGFGFRWPASRNYAWPGYKEWLDKTKAPFA